MGWICPFSLRVEVDEDGNWEDVLEISDSFWAMKSICVLDRYRYSPHPFRTPWSNYSPTDQRCMQRRHMPGGLKLSWFSAL